MIQQHAKAWAIASSSCQEIDELNILQASLLAMQRAVAQLTLIPERVLVDGNQLPNFSIAAQAIIQGDSKVAAISAASILAKVARDQYMLQLGQQYPEYGFSQHKGYPTKLHMQRLAEYGPCPEHRKSFAPVKKTLIALGDLPSSQYEAL